MENNKCEVPEPKDPNSLADQFLSFVEIVKILRKKCPWDRKQTTKSISQLLIEETYEAIDAINNNDDEEFSKELGDILLHVVMHSVIAEETGRFNMINVLEKIQKKLVHRHPHVFGSVTVNGEKDVMQNWENLKIEEGQKSILQGVPKILPALMRAQRLQFKASKVGFDWENKTGVWEKIEEELLEFKKEIESKNYEKAAEELGDIIFAIVNAARFEQVVAEEALQKTNDKFTRRFQYIEKKAAELEKNLSEMTLGEMDKFWEEAKQLES
ncbi:nucleoside triphosphate pyrophosphohydrolase [Bacteroidota bacterium]